MDSVAELVAYLGLAIDEESWAKGQEIIERTRHGVEKLNDTKKKAEEGEKSEYAETLKKGLETLIGYEGFKSIEELIEHTMEATIQAKHLGERLGITTEAVQGLGYAADVTGASSGAMTSALQRLSFNLQQTGMHGHGAAGALSKMGISVSELKKLSLDEQLGVIADKFKDMKDGPEKVALAMKLFGRQAGPQLIPLLNEGKEGIKELREEAERLGVTTSEENVKKAEELERAQKRLAASFGAVKDKIAFALIPVFEALARAMSVAVVFLQEHEGVLIAILSGIAAAMIYLGVVSAIAWASTVGPILLVIAGVAILVGWVETLIDLFEGKLHGAIKVITIALAIMFLPITALVAAIYGIVKGVQYLIANWDDLKARVTTAFSSWSDFKNAIEEYAPEIAAALIIAFGPIGAAVAGLMWIIDHWDAITSSIDINKIPGAAEGRPLRDDGGPSTKDVDAVSGASAGAKEDGPTKVEIHAPVTINANGDPATIHKHIKEHHERVVRDAYHDIKKGG